MKVNFNFHQLLVVESIHEPQLQVSQQTADYAGEKSMVDGVIVIK